MNTEKTVLLLYPEAIDQQVGQALKNGLDALDAPVKEIVIDQNYDEVLDWLEKSVVPVVSR